MTLNADEAKRLRHALSLIATSIEPMRTKEFVGEAPPASAPQPQRTRGVTVAFVAAGVAATAAIAWSVTDRGAAEPEAPSSDMAAESAQSPGEYWACAETIVEGRVTDVQPSGPDRMRVMVDARKWIKPTSGPSSVRLDLPDPETQGLREIRTGVTYLLSVPTNKYLAADTFRNDDIANGLRVIAEGRDEALARGITECPAYWRDLRP